MRTPFSDLPVELDREFNYPQINNELDVHSPFLSIVQNDGHLEVPVPEYFVNELETSEATSHKVASEGEWDEVKNKKAIDIAIDANNTLWIISDEKDKEDYNIYQSTPNGWVKIGGAARRIAVTSDGTAWVVNTAGQIFQKIGDDWIERPVPGGNCKDIGIGGPKDAVWIIAGQGSGPDHKIHQWISSSNTWQTIDEGAGLRIAVANNGRPWVVNSLGQLFRRDVDRWSEITGLKNCKDVGIGANDEVWIIGGEMSGTNYGIHRWHANFTWHKEEGAGIAISVGPGGTPYVVNASGQIYRLITSFSTAGYDDLNNSGVPLQKITDRNKKLSENFTVGEFAQVQNGKYKWNYARIDPALVDALQLLRNFLKQSITIVDGYYPPKYLKDFLKVTDPVRIAANSNISGREVKISVKGFDNAMKQIAMAAIRTCGRDIHVSIGITTMTLAVKKALIPGQNVDMQRITSYISDEVTKVTNYKFCIDFKNIVFDNFLAYEESMNRATAAFAVFIFKMYYKQNSFTDPRYNDWAKHLGDTISIMYGLSQTKNPNVILYCLAYSSFGNLYRSFVKDTSGNAQITRSSIIEEIRMKSPDPNLKDYLTAYEKLEDKTQFLDTLYSRIFRNRDSNGHRYMLVPAGFFDWMHNKWDKGFLDTISKIITNVYTINRYATGTGSSQLPSGGTQPNHAPAVPNPDKPVVDFTGRYVVDAPAGDPNLYGRFLLINQSGNYISGKFGGVYKAYLSSSSNLAAPIQKFYGKINEAGVAICDLYPQKTVTLKKNSTGQVEYTLIDNIQDMISYRHMFNLRKRAPVISALVLDSFVKLRTIQQDLLTTLAWAMPLPSQIKEFLNSLKICETEIKKAITQYYTVGGTPHSIKQGREKAFENMVFYYQYYNLQNYDAFLNYYRQFFFSITTPWQPTASKELRSVFGWIKRVMEDFRDYKSGSDYIVTKLKDFYLMIGVDTDIPVVIYKYHIKINTEAMGIGPFSRLTGKIVIKNETDYFKYPNADRWDVPSKSYSITLWNATLSLSLQKWRPKISAGSEMTAEGYINVPYYINDFAAAEIQITEGTLFNVSGSVGSDSSKLSIGTGITKRFVIIQSGGKKVLNLEELDTPKIPDSLTADVQYSKDEDPGIVSGDFSLPSLSLYKGDIGTQKVSTVINTVPPADSFASQYNIQTTNFFKHDDGTLSSAAIDAIGRMCAEEVMSFMDPNCDLAVYAHTDASGTADYNLRLSKLRADNTLQAIKDRLGSNFKITVKNIKGLGEAEANTIFGQYSAKNAWLRKVIIIINGRVVLSLSEI